MATDPTFRLYAYQRGADDDKTDVRRVGIPDWHLPAAIRWALSNGRDSLLIELVDDPPRVFGSAENGVLLAHHVCADSACPGGCEDETEGS